MLAPGLADPVHHAQQVFRALLDVMARPGRIGRIDVLPPRVPLPPALALALLALADETTPVWWQRHAVATAMAPYLRFHTGAPSAAAPAQAVFAVIDDPIGMPAFSEFPQGTAAAPDRSATLLIEVQGLDGGAAVEWHGPGIAGSSTMQIAGLPADFWSRWNENHAAFPQGVDALLFCGERVVGLPRTTRARQLESV